MDKVAEQCLLVAVEIGGQRPGEESLDADKTKIQY